MIETDTIYEKIKEKGFPFSVENIVNLYVGGSHLYGGADEKSDYDIYGVFIEPPENILGLKLCEHFVTSDKEEQNKPGDVDITLYSLHNWGKLVMKGNPNISYSMYADNLVANPRIWDFYIKPLKEYLISKKLIKQYLGFANAQRMRLTDEKGMGRHGQRPDLVEKYGYDTKFAMHYIRLLLECREVLETSTLKFPNKDREMLRGIKNGRVKYDTLMNLGNAENDVCEALLQTSTLKDVPDINLLSKTIAKAYQVFWMNK